MQPNVKEWDRGRQISVLYLEAAPHHDPVETPPLFSQLKNYG